MYSPTRHEAREFLFGAWEKYRVASPLTELERIAVEIIVLHPEYHALLEARERNIDHDFSPEHGQLNPFLHLGLHLGLAEQLALDRPHGVRAELDRLTRTHDNRHDALHAALECLGETMWGAQRSGMAPDPEQFLECLRRK